MKARGKMRGRGVLDLVVVSLVDGGYGRVGEGQCPVTVKVVDVT